MSESCTSEKRVPETRPPSAAPVAPVRPLRRLRHPQLTPLFPVAKLRVAQSAQERLVPLPPDGPSLLRPPVRPTEVPTRGPVQERPESQTKAKQLLMVDQSFHSESVKT